MVSIVSFELQPHHLDLIFSVMPLSHSDYTVAYIYPIWVELAPIKALLNETHPRLSTQRDQNSYVLGEMGAHNVVIAVLPKIRNNAAATMAI